MRGLKISPSADKSKFLWFTSASTQYHSFFSRVACSTGVFWARALNISVCYKAPS